MSNLTAAPFALTDAQRSTLRALCDTIVPSVDRKDDPHGFWKRKATDLGIDQYVEGFLATLPAEQSAGMAMLLDGLAMQDFVTVPTALSREQILVNTSLSSSMAAAGLAALRSLILMLYYGVPDPATGQNPNWLQYGYPGPVAMAPAVAKHLPVTLPHETTTLTADAVIVGSGAGGSVIAAKLAAAGLSVVILEAGGYFNESDFAQSEMKAYSEMYWRAGPQTSADGNFTLMAGSTLGGGTVVNWTNCVRTPDWVRREWAKHGLDGLDGPEFDEHLDTVLARIGAIDTCSDVNPAQEKVLEGADKLGWHHKITHRNADPAKYTAETAGYIGFGDHTGSKNSSDKNWLNDAVGNGAKIFIRTRARKVLVENGKATGVEAVATDPVSGETAHVTVRAPRVIVAAGSLESPALLLRSGIGGPAAGQNLRLHPCTAVLTVQAQDMKAWWGAPHAMIIDEFANPESTYGFLIEGSQYATALGAAATPWTGGVKHKELIADTSRSVTTIGLLRDHGSGRVTIDANGESVITYAITDPIDVENWHKATEAQIRLGAATGASAMYLVAPSLPRWRYGDDIEAFVEESKRLPIGYGGVTAFSAHQMGSCRMGSDPATSVANPSGELHDVSGVWIGDGSAFPTPSGANPMVSIMALAHRTAGKILAGVPAHANGAHQNGGVAVAAHS